MKTDKKKLCAKLLHQASGLFGNLVPLFQNRKWQVFFMFQAKGQLLHGTAHRHIAVKSTPNTFLFIQKFLLRMYI